MKRTEKNIQQIHRIARDIGIPLDSLENIAISVPRAARLIDIQPRTLRKALQLDGIKLIRILGTDRIDVIDFVEFLERQKTGEIRGKRKEAETWASLSALDRAALIKND